MFFIHYEEEGGQILSVLNAQRHVLKTPNISISAKQRDAIVQTPSRFIVKNRQLVDLGQQSNDAEIETVKESHKRIMTNSKICGYVDSDAICWMSDDLALMELNLALNICSLDKKFLAKIHCMINGVRTLKEVDNQKLLVIAKQVYKIRTCADELYLNRLHEIDEINQEN